MSDSDDSDEGVFMTPMLEEFSDVICQRALAMCKVAEIAYGLSDDGELRSELVTMLKKINTSVALPTEAKTAKLTVIK